MPLTPDEIVKLPSEVGALIKALADARAVDSEGGTKITRAERRKLLALAGRLVSPDFFRTLIVADSIIAVMTRSIGVPYR